MSTQETGKKTVAILLGSGGYLAGVWEVGVLLILIPRLETLGYTVRFLGGSSVGAINAAVLAQAHSDEELRSYLAALYKMWERVKTAGPHSVFPLPWWRVAWSLLYALVAVFVSTLLNKRVMKASESILSGKTLWQLLDGKLLGTDPVDCERIVASPIRFDATVMDEETGRYEVASNKDATVQGAPKLLQAFIVAGASIVPFFPAVTIGGRRMVDFGGMAVRRTLELGYDIVIALVPVSEQGERRNRSLLSYAWPFRTSFVLGNLIERHTVKSLNSALEIEVLRREIEELKHERGYADRLFALNIGKTPPDIQGHTFTEEGYNAALEQGRTDGERLSAMLGKSVI